MIFLDHLYNLPNSTSGIDQIAIDSTSIVPQFFPFMLLFLFMVIFIGGAVRQKARLGNADFALWAVVASLITFMATLILSTATGFIRLDWLSIVVAITILSGVWLFLDRRQSEV